MVFLFPSISRSNSREKTTTLSLSLRNPNPNPKPSRSTSTRSSVSSFSTDIRSTPTPTPTTITTTTPTQPPVPRPPKSPRRFWTFSTQIAPPLPPISDIMSGHSRSSSTSSILGAGAELIRRPSEAARGMKQQSRIRNGSGSRSPAPTLPDQQTIHEKIETMSISSQYTCTTTMEPRSAPLPNILTTGYDGYGYGGSASPPNLPVTAPLRTNTGRSSMKSTRSRHPDECDRRATIRPPPQSALPPIPFSFHLLSNETRPAPTTESSTIIVLEFAYSTDEQRKNDPVRLTLEMLKRGGGHLVQVIEEELSKRNQVGRSGVQRDSLESERSGPSMTDGETSEESELGSSELDSGYGLEALLKDEYLRSLMLPDSPSFLKDFPQPPPMPATFSITIPTTNKPRAHTRNQYAQQDKFPSPSSPFTARSINTLPLNLPSSAKKAPLTISTAAIPPTPAPAPASAPASTPPIELPKIKDAGGRITELRILLLRDSMPYHIIAQRLVSGSFVNTALHGDIDTGRRRKVEEEARWLKMARLVQELGDGPSARHERSPSSSSKQPGLKHKKSAVLTGGQGYI